MNKHIEWVSVCVCGVCVCVCVVCVCILDSCILYLNVFKYYVFLNILKVENMVKMYEIYIFENSILLNIYIHNFFFFTFLILHNFQTGFCCDLLSLLKCYPHW